MFVTHWDAICRVEGRKMLTEAIAGDVRAIILVLLGSSVRKGIGNGLMKVVRCGGRATLPGFVRASDKKDYYSQNGGNLAKKYA